MVRFADFGFGKHQISNFIETDMAFSNSARRASIASFFVICCHIELHSSRMPPVVGRMSRGSALLLFQKRQYLGLQNPLANEA
jgi:hypothetical protein